MTKKKKGGEKMNSQSKRRCSGKRGKKEQDNPITQAKMFCTEASSHEKGGNYNRALHCYNLYTLLSKGRTNLPITAFQTPANKLSKGATVKTITSVCVPWQRTRKAIILPKVPITKAMDEGRPDHDGSNSDEENTENKTPREEEEEEEETGESPPAKKEAAAPKKIRKRKGKKKGKQQNNEKQGMKKKQEEKPPSPRISSKSTFAQIAKELKAKRLAQMAYAAQMAKKRRRNRVLRDEEIYTDKDRAAAVNMGTTDIKQSLKLKKKQDKNHCSQIPEEAEPATLLVLGNNELRNGDLKTALKFMNKALELNPDDKNGLVARSKCYLSLGHPQLALKDAETALQSDKTFVRAIYQKAEALYHLGDFEHSLMYYHRGHRLRPELECFRLGVQKAQEAIENTIGSTARVNSRKPEKTIPSSTSSSAKTESDKSRNENDTKRSNNSMSSGRARSKSAAPSVKNSSSSRFIGELIADRLYLENLLKHPDLICSNQEAASIIKKQAEEGITFLKSRQEFWRQQKPNSSPITAPGKDSQKESSEPAQQN